jgi:hypothetical protein
MLILNCYATEHLRDGDEGLVIEDGPNDFETMQLLGAGN